MTQKKILKICICVYFHALPDNNLYSATSMNFLGSEPILTRSSPVTIRTEFKTSWLHGQI